MSDVKSMITYSSSDIGTFSFTLTHLPVTPRAVLH